MFIHQIEKNLNLIISELQLFVEKKAHTFPSLSYMNIFLENIRMMDIDKKMNFIGHNIVPKKDVFITVMVEKLGLEMSIFNHDEIVFLQTLIERLVNLLPLSV